MLMELIMIYMKYMIISFQNLVMNLLKMAYSNIQVEVVSTIVNKKHKKIGYSLIELLIRFFVTTKFIFVEG